MLSYAAHIPHSPILVPAIGPERSRVLKRVRAALAEIAADLESRKIETVITITPHGEGTGGSFLLQSAPRFEIQFRPFGDFATRAEISGEPHLASAIQHALGGNYPVQAVTPRHLDSASAVAAVHLAHSKKNYRLLPITYRLADISELESFGNELRDVVENAPHNIAVLSLGDLARTPKEQERAGKTYDQSIISHLASHEQNSLRDYSIAEADAFRVCGFRPLALLLGLLGTMKKTTDIVSYERAHGIGMMVARFGF